MGNKEIQVNTLTTAQRANFRDLATPEVKKIIVENYGPEAEAMMKAFLEAVHAASYSQYLLLNLR